MTAASAGIRDRGLLRRRGRRSTAAKRDRLGAAGGFVLLALVAIAVFGPLIQPLDPNEQNLTNALSPPVYASGGSWEHVLGTDELGRDVLSRLIAGARFTLLIGFVAAALETLIGVTLGIIAGFRGGFVHAAIMRWTDIQMGFPVILLALLIILVFGVSVPTLILALGLNGWMVFARVVRSDVQRIRNEHFIEASRVAGMHGFEIVRRHVLPQLKGRIGALYLMEVPRVILAAAGLSFLGLGIGDPNVDWGLMIGESRATISVAYWPSLFPGLAIVSTVASVYLFALWLEPRIDPLRRAQRG